MSHPKRADHFREWSKLMLEQAIVPDRLQYKSVGLGGTKKQAARLTKASLAGKRRGKKFRRTRRKRQRKGLRR